MRLERLLAILMLLINRKRISAAELADKMEVSVRTIYRDIDTLCQAGFPLVSFPGVNGGFAVMDGYKLERNALTFDEIASVLSALKGMTKVLDDEKLDATLEKYAGLLTDREKETARFWEERLVIDTNPWGADGAVKRKVALIREALQNDTVIRFAYTTANGASAVREVEPMTLLLQGITWYVYGYCLLRGDFRLFRLSRLSQLERTDRRFVRREHPPMSEADWDRLWHTNATTVTFTLRFRPEARMRAEEVFGVDKVAADADGAVTVTETYPEDEWLYGFLLGLGDKVEVVEPARLRGLIRDRARAIWERYAEDASP
ncbi:helix-turn-helix transcriptional regulator [Paenibacillus flagellatus]|uniref:helix-turn-helix transcriptional regulator n=1 Tax=Paenibacillus flagellatus TaxID=2211139 RepID=UPI00130532A2|nr:YafY family protein [Paenibacillus flagellatus]